MYKFLVLNQFELSVSLLLLDYLVTLVGSQAPPSSCYWTTWLPSLGPRPRPALAIGLPGYPRWVPGPAQLLLLDYRVTLVGSQAPPSSCYWTTGLPSLGPRPRPALAIGLPGYPRWVPGPAQLLLLLVWKSGRGPGIFSHVSDIRIERMVERV